jgi:hypothetical protein
MTPTPFKLASYPSIYALGHRALTDLFDGDVVVQEKVDGSQISFGHIAFVPRTGKPCDHDGCMNRCEYRLIVRSKGKDQTPPTTDKMFATAVEQIERLTHLRAGYIYRGEYLSKPKHNALAYGRTPEHNIILFDVETSTQAFLDPAGLAAEAARVGLESVPTLYTGKVDDWAGLKLMLQRESILGGALIEGVVVKNYARFGIDKKVLMGKYVSEAFKEVHQKEWGKANPNGKDIVAQLVEAYRTDARWQKSVQHLTEDGALDGSPKDIGPLIKAVNLDVLAECEADIRDALFRWAWPTISRRMTAGLAEWYKEKLAASGFENTP